MYLFVTELVTGVMHFFQFYQK